MSPYLFTKPAHRRVFSHRGNGHRAASADHHDRCELISADDVAFTTDR
jgi:hypothetical protein